MSQGSNLTTRQLDNWATGQWIVDKWTTRQLDNLENFTGSQRLSDFQTFFFWFSNILTWSGLDHRDAY